MIGLHYIYITLKTVPEKVRKKEFQKFDSFLDPRKESDNFIILQTQKSMNVQGFFKNFVIHHFWPGIKFQLILRILIFTLVFPHENLLQLFCKTPGSHRLRSIYSFLVDPILFQLVATRDVTLRRFLPSLLGFYPKLN